MGRDAAPCVVSAKLKAFHKMIRRFHHPPPQATARIGASVCASRELHLDLRRFARICRPTGTGEAENTGPISALPRPHWNRRLRLLSGRRYVLPTASEWTRRATRRVLFCASGIPVWCGRRLLVRLSKVAGRDHIVEAR